MSILGFFGALIGVTSIIDDVNKSQTSAQKRHNAKYQGEATYFDSRGVARLVSTNEKCFYDKHPTANRLCYTALLDRNKVLYDPDKERLVKEAKEQKKRWLEDIEVRKQNAIKNGINNIHIRSTYDGYDEYENLTHGIRYKVYSAVLLSINNKKQAECMEEKYGAWWVEWCDHNGRQWKGLTLEQRNHLEYTVKKRYSIEKLDILFKIAKEKVSDVEI